AGKACPRETPQAQRRRGGSLTARGKRVPGVEKILQPLKKTVDKLDFHRVCLQSEVPNLIGTSHLQVIIIFHSLVVSAYFQ
ncbi:hypothetical protein, partial [Peribacillus butanolivorans]|uniref:hypothetical protein n=1 Tax=Peribacillus butanolivorans TaxID=421767 RepID=UPI0035DB4914